MRTKRFSEVFSWSNLFTILVLGFVLYRQGPSWFALYKREGTEVSPFLVQDPNGSKTNLPVLGKKQILIAWATWCGPCTVELGRFNQAVIDKEIDGSSIVAVSIGESLQLVNETATSRGYRFTIKADPDGNMSKSLPVSGTPSVFHVDERGIIRYSSMGFSPTALFGAKDFLH